jgi:hypothetical protein
MLDKADKLRRITRQSQWNHELFFIVESIIAELDSIEFDRAKLMIGRCLCDISFKSEIDDDVELDKADHQSSLRV